MKSSFYSRPFPSFSPSPLLHPQTPPFPLTLQLEWASHDLTYTKSNACAQCPCNAYISCDEIKGRLKIYVHLCIILQSLNIKNKIRSLSGAIEGEIDLHT